MKSIWAELGEEIRRNERERLIEQTRLETQKENAASMREDGMSDERIAKILRVELADVRGWLDSSPEGD